VDQRATLRSHDGRDARIMFRVSGGGWGGEKSKGTLTVKACPLVTCQRKIRGKISPHFKHGTTLRMEPSFRGVPKLRRRKQIEGNVQWVF